MNTFSFDELVSRRMVVPHVQPRRFGCREKTIYRPAEGYVIRHLFIPTGVIFTEAYYAAGNPEKIVMPNGVYWANESTFNVYIAI